MTNNWNVRFSPASHWNETLFEGAFLFLFCSQVARGAVVSKTGKIQVLYGFCEIEHGGTSPRELKEYVPIAKLF